MGGTTADTLPGETEQLPTGRPGALGARRGDCLAMASGSQHRRVGLGRCPQAGSAGPDRAARDTGRIVREACSPQEARVLVAPLPQTSPSQPRAPEAVLKTEDEESKAPQWEGAGSERQCPHPAHVSRAWKTAMTGSSCVVTTRTLRNLSTSASSWERRVFSLYMISSRWWRPRK